MKELILTLIMIAQFQTNEPITKQVAGYNRELPDNYRIVTCIIDYEQVYTFKRGEYVCPIFCNNYETAKSNAWQDYKNDQIRYDVDWEMIGLNY